MDGIKAVFHGKRPCVSLTLASISLLGLLGLLAAGCGGTAESTQPMSADQAAIVGEMESSGLFGTDLTDTSEDEEAASQAQAVPYTGVVSLQSLSAEEGTAASLPRFWWRGDVNLVQKDIDISIVGDTASVSVTHFLEGTFFIADDVGGTLVLWGKPFEDTAVRHAQFARTPAGWKLTEISPVDINLTNMDQQTVEITWLGASVNGETVWETDAPDNLFEVPGEIPTFSTGEEVLVEVQVENSSTSGFNPAQFVFLHRPGPGLFGKRIRDVMFDDGTNGDITAGDGIYSRTYTIGPCKGRHFAAVDVIDSATFAQLEAPYNSTAWGMPYIIQ
ncbi:MAG: hypothetical protein GXP52_08565 [Deltaproteobacteria bacterium]|nr:hypothetical protein [Deltaproteobacteria bacterium]